MQVLRHTAAFADTSVAVQVPKHLRLHQVRLLLQLLPERLTHKLPGEQGAASACRVGTVAPRVVAGVLSKQPPALAAAAAAPPTTAGGVEVQPGQLQAPWHATKLQAAAAAAAPRGAAHTAATCTATAATAAWASPWARERS